MTQDATEIVVAKGGAVYVAPSGTALPDKTDPRDALDPLFTEVGYVTEDGAVIGADVDLLEIMSWQKARPVRREANTRNFSAQVGLEQWNAHNLTLAFGGGVATETASGVFCYEFPTDVDPLDELALIIDYEDQGSDWRIVYASGNVTEGVESSLIRTAAAVLPVTYRALEDPPYLVTDAPSFGHAS